MTQEQLESCVNDAVAGKRIALIHLRRDHVKCTVAGLAKLLVSGCSDIRIKTSTSMRFASGGELQLLHEASLSGYRFDTVYFDERLSWAYVEYMVRPTIARSDGQCIPTKF